MSDVVFMAGDDVQLPTRATEDAFGYDVYVAQDTIIPPKTTVIVSTGLYLAEPLPKNLALLVLPRSSLALKRGLIVANSPGLVDRCYDGEIGVLVHNLREAATLLQLGERIAQFLFTPVVHPRIAVGSRSPLFAGRGGGFGSSGA